MTATQRKKFMELELLRGEFKDIREWCRLLSGDAYLMPWKDGAPDWESTTRAKLTPVNHWSDLSTEDVPRLAVLTNNFERWIDTGVDASVLTVWHDGYPIARQIDGTPCKRAVKIIEEALADDLSLDDKFGLDPEPVPLIAANDNARGQLTYMGDDDEYVPKPELIRDTIPRNGVGFFGGQSGALKTFMALHASTCLMTGEPLAGRDIERTGGVVYMAAEGEGTIKGRFKARRMQLADPSAALPFFRLTKFGAITDAAAYAALEQRLVEADRQIKSRFGVPLVAVIVDTVSAAGMIPEDRENDSGTWQKVFDALQPISERLDIVIILIHHAGKNASAGLRGSSNARAAADFALMMACDRDEITGDTRNHFLHLAKSRDAAEGPIAAVQKRIVEIACRDDGTPITTLVLDFDTAGKAPAAKLKTSKTDKPFREAFDACELHRVRVHGESNAAEVQAAKLEDMRREFGLRYVTDQSDPVKRADNVRNAFRTAITRARDGGEYVTGAWAETEWIWRLKP